ncbi:hypothetical protein BX616_002729 [Lobosporangium transversale]|uniref:Ysc84 actin-binding domain-containing protein n=1 Tax=Lobosporangium transversale TaxID=64571 RepID=A0A1Y2GPJ5_9FUNG|nr:hypothetical protein BCR41DRAFT_353662 [Lobosporangium transversale]KAF9900034.1 hypothetical protein BX616_002729 [Lobosporangium transversale]ORZ16195.1 hypothetical protein BCR41DRAFT_353662 [Lobosporangium transversale]|eukprot:XP_021881542.1 hypothetical protein BCR41DRAFT_353662 [Lobosporangium transversale]
MSFMDRFKSVAQDMGKMATEAGKRFQETAAVTTRQMTDTAKNANISSPLPDENVTEDLKKAANLLRSFVDKEENETGFDNIIPPGILRKAKGLAIYTVVKAGFIVSARGGSGVAVIRKDDGQWSAPSFIATGGVGFGAQVGADVTDVVLVLMTDEAVEAMFVQGGGVSLGGGLSVSAGPVGVGGELGLATSSQVVAAASSVFSYTKSKGLFAGVSLDGTILLERKEANAAFYGRAISAAEILKTMPQPPEALELYTVIEIGLAREL